MGLVSSSAPGFHNPDAATPRVPARLAAIEQSRKTQLLDLDDAEDLLDALDMELQKGDTDYLSFGRERMLRRRLLPICSGALADTKIMVRTKDPVRTNQRRKETAASRSRWPTLRRPCAI